MRVTRDGRFLFAATVSEASAADTTSPSEAMTTVLTLHDLKNHTSRVITTHGARVCSVALDSAETLLVTGDLDGVTRAGSITGEVPHLLLGSGWIYQVAVSPDGRWIASATGTEATLRLWPMPEGRPFHTLPTREFLNRLCALTYLRVIPDRKSPTGYRQESAPYSGWEKVPTW
jgi:WD40 repeat protein